MAKFKQTVNTKGQLLTVKMKFIEFRLFHNHMAIESIIEIFIKYMKKYRIIYKFIIVLILLEKIYKNW